MPPIHMPACPVSTTTMASSGRWRDNSPQMRSGRIGTAAEVRTDAYLAAYSRQIVCASLTQPARRASVLRRPRLVRLRPDGGAAKRAPRHDYRPLGRLQQRKGRHDAGALGFRPERRHLRQHRLYQRLEFRLLGIDLAFVAAKLQMHW